MLFMRVSKTVLMILLMNLFIVSFSLNLRKQFDDKIFNYEKELEHLYHRNNTFPILNNYKDSENKINFQINKHHVKEEHLDLDSILLGNKSKFEDFNRNFEIHKAIDEIQDLNIFNNKSSDSENLLNYTDQLLKIEKDLLLNSPLEEHEQNNKINKTVIKENKSNTIVPKNTDGNIQNKTDVKYDFFYYPKASGSKFNLPLRRDGVFGCSNCANAFEEENNSMNIKVPDEDKWINLHPVKFVKQISAESKAALEIENIDDPEYKNILKSGYQNPRFIRDIVRSFPTNVQKPSNVNSIWKPAITLDSTIWQNVDFNLYNNPLMDTTRFNTPASFSYSEAGIPITNRPSNSQMQIISPALNTISSSAENDFGGLDIFIETEIKEAYIDDTSKLFG